MRILIYWFALALAILFFVAGDSQLQAPTRCEEDMPCWNCATMGNHVCGNGSI